MTEERDIAGFALPFAAGALSASLIPFPSAYCIGAAASMSAVMLTLFMMTWKFRMTGISAQRTIICAAAFLTGASCLSAATATSLSSIRELSFISGSATAFCQRLKDIISAIPFSNHETPALMTALLTGDRTALPHEVTEAFRTSGASHILALSGMHLGIIYSLLSSLISKTGNSPRIKTLRSSAIILCCGFYTIGTGAGESITRAFLFILLNEIGTLTHRKASLKELIMAALIIQLAVDPLSVRSVSFQLSYAAMAGIAFIHPHLKGLWPDDGKGPMRKIWESASISISCQMTTGPLAWLYFRTFPQYFLLTNLIAVPLAGMIIPISLLTIASSAAGICPDCLISMTERLMSLLTGALRGIAQM